MTTVTALNHINLRAPHVLMEALRDFYRDVVGLREGPRPAFGSRGFWLYAGETAVVHLSEQSAAEAGAPADVRGTYDHAAFSALDPEEAARTLRAHGVTFRVDRNLATRQHHFFFVDPAGNGVELNFPFVDDDSVTR
jgi:catechol 2,3-dioxygenase-like lactoylglutathione lyase family enzyme